MMRPGRFDLLERWIIEQGWKCGAELGILRGDLFFYLLDRFPHLCLIGVDSWRGEHRSVPLDQYRQEVFSKIVAYGPRALALCRTTDEAAMEVQNGSLDFVFIDADHAESSVRRDIANWLPKLTATGWLIGHDYSDKFPGVMAAIDDLLPGRLLWPDDVWSIERSAAC